MFTGELRDFQTEAVGMMHDLGGLLVASVMGSGKTVITIAAIEELLEDGRAEMGLVIVPAPLKYQWKTSIEDFTDVARVLVIDGTPKQRADQYHRATRYEYVVLNYDQLLNDWADIIALPFDFVVCDEVQAIKSFKAKRSKLVKQLDSPFRFGLTGTAIENKPEEVFSIMEWVSPGLLGSFRVFDNTFIERNRFGGVERYKNLDLLHKRLSEAMFRRSYADIADQLPTVDTQVRTVALGRDAMRLYRTITTDLLGELEAAAGLARSFSLEAHYGSEQNASPQELAMRGRIMSRMTCLRMLCDHPQLLRLSAQRYNNADEDAGSAYAAELLERGLLDVTPARKFSEVVGYIEDIIEDSPDNKVVLFSFFVDTLDWLHDVLAEVGIRSVRYSGRLSSKEKEEARVEFTTNKDVRVFLSSDAGGVGVDLPQANYLINYDLPWSGGQLAQRKARIRRISSKFPRIHVIDVLADATIELRQYETLKKKGAVAAAVMDGDMSETNEVAMDLGTLKDFLLATSS